MAKAKKTTKTKKDEPSSAPVAAKKDDAKQAAKPVTAPAPLIDTGMAAAAAARGVLHHKDEPSGHPASSRESASFKQMKENLHKPAGSSPSFLQNIAPTKKFNPAVPGRQQMGRNQTFGADVNRSGVPRRTGG
jgi:hypothetical protein